MVCITGGKLAEEVLELLPDYSLAFMGEDGPAGTAAEEGGVELDRGCAYYTAECVQQLNAQYGDLQHRIADLEVGRVTVSGTGSAAASWHGAPWLRPLQCSSLHVR